MSAVHRFHLAALTVVVAVFVIIPVVAQQPAPASVTMELVGTWAPQVQEDFPHRGPGAELGDYTGLPLNDAGRQKAEAWAATILSQPERQTQAHPVQYSMRGPGPRMRVSEIRETRIEQQRLIAYLMQGMYGRADRTIWLDGRKHPSDRAEHTWNGFSTGVWENGVLIVTTTHMKQGVLQRNGVPSSPYGKMVERFFRHGLYLTMFSSVDDPIYLEEPMVRTQTWAWDPSITIADLHPFEPVDELGDKPLGWVPFNALGTHHAEFGKAYNIPFQATQGGKESLYPEFQSKIDQWRKDEAAREAAVAESAKTPGTGARKR